MYQLPLLHRRMHGAALFLCRNDIAGNFTAVPALDNLSSERFCHGRMLRVIGQIDPFLRISIKVVQLRRIAIAVHIFVASTPNHEYRLRRHLGAVLSYGLMFGTVTLQIRAHP